MTKGHLATLAAVLTATGIAAAIPPRPQVNQVAIQTGAPAASTGPAGHPDPVAAAGCPIVVPSLAQTYSDSVNNRAKYRHDVAELNAARAPRAPACARQQLDEVGPAGISATTVPAAQLAHLELSTTSGPIGTVVHLVALNCPPVLDQAQSAYFHDSANETAVLDHTGSDTVGLFVLTRDQTGPTTAVATYQLTTANSPGVGLFVIECGGRGGGGGAAANFTVRP